MIMHFMRNAWMVPGVARVNTMHGNLERMYRSERGNFRCTTTDVEVVYSFGQEQVANHRI